MNARNLIPGFILGFVTATVILLSLGQLSNKPIELPEISVASLKLPAEEKTELFERLYASLKKECDIPEKSLNQWRHTAFVYVYGTADLVQSGYEEIKDKCKRGTF